jgi:hypothetical protein
VSWFPVDDALHSHPKARKAGLEAMGLWTVSGSFCMAYLTDGFISEWWVKQQPRGLVLAKRLIEAGLWRRSKKAGEEGFQFHDWKPECTKAHVLEAREKARQRKAKSRASQGESRVTGHVTDASRHACVPSTTQPNPTQPITKELNLGGEVTQVGATEPPPRCPKHLSHPDPPNCIACRDARKANETWHAGELDRRRQARAAAAAIADNCPICHGTKWIPDTEPAVKCDHQEVS